MDILFYFFVSMCAIYAILHIVDFAKWYWNVITIVPKAIWNLIKNIFGK